MHKSVALDAIGGDARTLKHSLRRTNRYSVTPFLTNRVSPAKRLIRVIGRFYMPIYHDADSTRKDLYT